MKELHFIYRAAVGRATFTHNDKADAAYATVKAAMQEFKEYGNDKEKTISFDCVHGEQTVRLADLISVSIVNLDDPETEAATLAIAVWNARMKEKIDAAVREGSQPEGRRRSSRLRAKRKSPARKGAP